MNERTTNGYRAYAAILDNQNDETPSSRALIAPAGRAFALVYNASSRPADPASNFSCLYHHAETNDSGQDCTLDGAGLGGHPSPEGSYLIAAVMVGTIHRKSVVGAKWIPPQVTCAKRDFLQHVAQQAVFGAN